MSARLWWAGNVCAGLVPEMPTTIPVRVAAGELLVVLGAFALWWAYGREARWWAWLVAAVPALAYSALYLANAYMTGILIIRSTGLTIWP